MLLTRRELIKHTTVVIGIVTLSPKLSTRLSTDKVLGFDNDCGVFPMRDGIQIESISHPHAMLKPEGESIQYDTPRHHIT